jgi:uncharacterized spore protein YtfJ
MENVNFLENFVAGLGQNATVKNVYGEPVITHDKTIIPVATVMYGFGGGFGQGKDKPLNAEQKTENKRSTGEGMGGGGGLIAKPKGVYEISNKCTRFIPANYTSQLIAAIFIGFLIKTLITKKMVSKK